ncbi:uncharacterized protein isoform X1 [Leptinotarsa decemlineata]|uniref:uncharacterized protein isoform X1 n=1 Tax=Leptinotarsa decemlineata TaxID=7539 RepID=UPI003D30D3FA
MYKLTKTLSNTYSSVSLHAIKSVQKHIQSSSQGNLLKKKKSLPSFSQVPFGQLVDKVLKRGVSNYTIHPEKLKQIMKANESQTLCHFFGSAEYQKRLRQIMENQKRLLSESSPAGIPESQIKYEHIINCAQPVINLKNEVKNEKPQEEVITLLEKKKKKKPIRTTIMSVILKKKRKEQEELIARRGHSTIMPLVMQSKMRNKEMKKKFRRRTTILPIFLQKMEQIKEKNEAGTDKPGDEHLNSFYKIKKLTAPKSQKKTELCNYKNDNSLTHNIDSDGIQDSSGLVEKLIKSHINSSSKDGEIHTEKVIRSNKYSDMNFREDDISNEQETTKIVVEDCQPNPQGMNHSHSSYEVPKNTETIPEKRKVNKKAFWREFMKKWKRSSRGKLLKQEVSKSCEMNLPMENTQYEIDPSLVDVIDVSHIRSSSSSPRHVLQEFPKKVSKPEISNLFTRMKEDI